MGPLWIAIVVCLLATGRAEEDIDGYLKFPLGFKLGVSGAAYQFEGGWNASDKSANIWDEFTHRIPSPIADGSNGDVACDSYHKYNEDIELLTDLGVDAYRLSLSWARILPNGFANKVSRDGIRYYRNLLVGLRERGIEPFVTIYHWDHPAVLEEMGGWTNELMVTWFVDYARVVFNELGYMVRTFATINEPTIFCNGAYGNGLGAPGKKLVGIGPYLCVHNMLKAHARVYRMYDEEFRARQNGKIGLAIPCDYYYPKYPNDTESASVEFDFECDWVIHPIFSREGDYPEVMKRRIAENSRLEGYPRSRLPEFSRAEIDLVRGSADYLGLNHYTSYLTESARKFDGAPWYEDSGVIQSNNDSWPRAASSWLNIVPQGFGDLLRELKNRYDNPLVYVLENGVSDYGRSLEDYQRIDYHHDYIRELLLAVNRDGCNVAGYFVWSFLDNFQWNAGYIERFGLVSVDFRDSNRNRTPKLSYDWFRRLINTRELPETPINRPSIEALLPYNEGPPVAYPFLRESPFRCVP